MEFSTNISDHKDDVMCILPWIHMHPWPNGKTMLCCDSPWEDHIGDLRENSLKEVWNSEKMKQVRLNMLNGKKCTQCVCVAMRKKIKDMTVYELEATETGWKNIGTRLKK